MTAAWLLFSCSSVTALMMISGTENGWIFYSALLCLIWSLSLSQQPKLSESSWHCKINKQKTVTVLISKRLKHPLVSRPVQSVMLKKKEKHMFWLSEISSSTWTGFFVVRWAQRPTCSRGRAFLAADVTCPPPKSGLQSQDKAACPFFCTVSAAAQWNLRASALSCSGSEPISAVCFRGRERKKYPAIL